MWRSLVAHFVRDEGVGGSNPLTPTTTLRKVLFPATITPNLILLSLEVSELGIISLRRTFSQPIYYYQLYGAAFLIILGLCWFIGVFGLEIQKLEVRDYNIRHCDFKANPRGPVLRILDAVYKENLDLVDTWCHTQEIAQHFSSLEVHRVHRDHLDKRELYESHYDLVLAKPELMNSVGQAGRNNIDYVLIAQYPHYGSQLVSLQGTPELSAAWMQGKTFGLVDDPNSVSAYQIPKAALRRSGLSQAPTLVYFRSYRQMYKALFEGSVDIIPALLSEEGPDSVLQLPPGLILEETIPGPAWYMHRELLRGRAYCDLQTALVELAHNSEVDYFRQLRIVRPCDVE